MVTAAAAPRQTSAQRFEVGVESVLRWGGIVLVALAAVFLVSTAIDRGWIGPELQLLGASLIGLGLLAGGARLLPSRRPWGLALANGGAAVTSICAGASYGWLELWDATTGLGLVAVAASIAVLVAMRLRTESVAITATLAMLIVPTVARIIADAPVLVTGTWLGLFAIAATAVGLERSWTIYRSLSTWAAALWVVGLAAALAGDDNTDHLAAGTALVAVVGLMLWLGPALARRSASVVEPRWLIALDHRSVLAIPLWSWLSILLFGGFGDARVEGLIGLAMAAGFVVLALAAGPLLGRLLPASPTTPSATLFTSHLLGAGLLATAALVGWLGGSVLLVALAGQAVATLVVANRLDDNPLRFNGYVLAAGSWLLLAAELLAVFDRGTLRLGDTVAYTVVTAAMVAVARLTELDQPAERFRFVAGVAWLAVLGFVSSLLVPVVDDRVWLSVGVAAAAASLVAARRLGPWVLATGGLLSLLVTLIGGLSIVGAAIDGTGIAGHAANLSVVAGLGVAAAWLWSDDRYRRPARALLTVAWIWSLGWIASVFLTELDGSIAQVAISVVWAVAAGAAIVAAVRSDDPVVRFIGLGTLAVVVVKLMTVDLAEVDTLWRVGLFLVIGLGLLRLGYLLPAMAERYGPQTPPVAPPAGPPGPSQVENPATTAATTVANPEAGPQPGH